MLGGVPLIPLPSSTVPKSRRFFCGRHQTCTSVSQSGGYERKVGTGAGIACLRVSLLRRATLLPNCGLERIISPPHIFATYRYANE